VPHVGAPVADLPVRRIVGATHFIADLTLPYGRVVHDYKIAQPQMVEKITAILA
jgi:acetoacetate decarboxylase